jgi:trehalose utilization protein
MARVTIWNEHRHEREDESVAEIYPDGIHAALADAVAEQGHDPRTTTLADPDDGLPASLLDDTDVLLWWGHTAHDEVGDDAVDRVVDRVLDGMGFIPLHSAIHSRPFRRLMGTPMEVSWREAAERERCWVVDRAHPIAAGLSEGFVVEDAEMYGEPCALPAPDDLIFVSWFEGGEVFRSGCAYHRGAGRIFYFRPGHETYPVFRQPEVRRVLGNAVAWAATEDPPAPHHGNRPEPLESIE